MRWYVSAAVVVLVALFALNFSPAVELWWGPRAMWALWGAGLLLIVVAVGLVQLGRRDGAR